MTDVQIHLSSTVICHPLFWV